LEWVLATDPGIHSGNFAQPFKWLRRASQRMKGQCHALKETMGGFSLRAGQRRFIFGLEAFVFVGRSTPPAPRGAVLIV
jgi:hypothetical protein